MGKIEWCDEQKNPFHGCLHGCEYCYARRFAIRHGGNPKSGGYFTLKKFGQNPFQPFFDKGKLVALSERLQRVKKPKRIFLGSMGDLGGMWDYFGPEQWLADGIKELSIIKRDNVIEDVRSIAHINPLHTFLLLTKNPRGLTSDMYGHPIFWPKNVHIGVSVTGAKEAVEKVGILRMTLPARTLLWVSLEPLLDPDFEEESLRGAEWVVVGAQTGPNAPRAEQFVKAAKRVVEWCKKNAVPCFVKNNMRQVDTGYLWPKELPK